MKKKAQKEEKKETSANLKSEAVKKDSPHKGYNENNPVQPQGAFKPDSKTTK